MCVICRKHNCCAHQTGAGTLVADSPDLAAMVQERCWAPIASYLNMSSKVAYTMLLLRDMCRASTCQSGKHSSKQSVTHEAPCNTTVKHLRQVLT